MASAFPRAHSFFERFRQHRKTHRLNPDLIAGGANLLQEPAPGAFIAGGKLLERFFETFDGRLGSAQGLPQLG